MNIERKTKCASYFKKELEFNHEYYTENIRMVFQKLTNIGDPLHPAEEVSYLINVIKAANDEMKTGDLK